MTKHVARAAGLSLVAMATTLLSAPSGAQVLSNIKAISVGGSLSCALTTAGGVKCWGYPAGNGSAAPVTFPVDVTGLTSGVKAIAAGDDLGCAVTSVGGVKCWGSNLDGALGTGSFADPDSYVPVDVAGLSSGVRTVAVGSRRACALLDSGHVKCWGFGYLGDGNTANPLYPSPVPVDVVGISDAIAVSVGFDDTCVVHASGALSCWGSGAGGQLGNGNTGVQLLPATIIGVGVSSVDGSQAYTCAVVSGSVSCWGNMDGIVGHEVLTPTPVPGASGATMVDVGVEKCLVTTGGAVKCWGTYGGLGDGTNQPSTTPVDVIGLSSGVTQVSVGAVVACALQGGQVFCWGYNGNGAVGDGTTANRSTPVAVIDPSLRPVPALSPTALALLALVIVVAGVACMPRGARHFA